MTPLLSVRNLVKEFPVKGGFLNRTVGRVHAVSGVSFEIQRGETLGLVGESGCGKSTLGRSLLRLIEPTAGEVVFDGVSVLDLDSHSLRAMRKRMQIVFQDPYASLNPRMTVEEIISEPLEIHKLCASRSERLKRISELLDLCGLRQESIARYPHEFSGGQRQRISIARALAVKPDFIVCDEPVSALDVSIQAQIVNLMQDLQKEFGLTYLFIAHDLKVVQHISTRIAVMYLGKIVECAEALELYERPCHPYTKALLSSIPRADLKRHAGRILLKGEVPSPLHPPVGCRFHTRCPIARPECSAKDPDFRIVSNGHAVACPFTA